MIGIEAKGWGWRHAGRREWAIRDLDLRVEVGERVLLLGPSGAGKSTLLAGLAGLLATPESGDEEGSLIVMGRLARTSRGSTGLVFQDPSTSLVMGRAGDDVAFGLENRGIPRADIWPRVAEALDSVGFPYPLGHPTSALSGGEQQRLALAGVLAMRPEILLLDEPSANLDASGADLFVESLQRVLDEDRYTLVLVEHRVERVMDLVERVVAFSAGGEILADGKPRDVFSNSAHVLNEAGIWSPGPSPPRASPRRLGSSPAVVADRATVRYDRSDPPALDGVSVEARAGEVMAVTGKNGSGKSTLALCLGGLLRPDPGDVRFLYGPSEKAYWKWRGKERIDHVGVVFQNPEHQFVTSSVASELAVGPRVSGVPEHEAVKATERLIERLDLSHLLAANPFTLSGGEKRRLSVATAISSAPELLVLDEPTFGQDSRTWQELVCLLSSLADEGCALVTVTHDERFMAAVADHRVNLRSGTVSP